MDEGRTCSNCGGIFFSSSLVCPVCRQPFPAQAADEASEATLGAGPRPIPPEPAPPLPAGETFAAAAPASGESPRTAPGRAALAGVLPQPLEDRFETMGLLGRGGGGTVFLVRDRRLDRTVALKLLLGELEGMAGAFESEARILARLEHERIVRLYDAGVVDRTAYLVMEYVRGISLSTRLSRGRPTLVEAVRVGIDMLDGIAAAHEHGIVHRDLKPANVFLDSSMRAKIADFGLAVFDRCPASQVDSFGDVQIAGTLGYMAPEQARGEVVGPEADVYSAGLILYEMLVGRRLIALRDPLALLEAQQEGKARAPSEQNPAVDRELDGIVLAALSPDSRARPSPSSLADRLRGWLARASRRVDIDPTKLPPRPYRPLAPFEAGDSMLFAGRDAEVYELESILGSEATRVVFLFGRCGAGKSSLIRAGLVPALAGRGSQVTVAVSGPDPLAAVIRALRAELPIDQRCSAAQTGACIDRSEVARLALRLAAIDSRPRVVVIDQLEEVVTHGDGDRRRLHALCEAIESLSADPAIPVRWLLSFRREFRADFFALEERLSDRSRTMDLGEIGVTGLVEAIERPARTGAYGFGFAQDFPAKLAADVLEAARSSGDSALPLVQIVCDQLVERARAAGAETIGPQLWEGPWGGASGALRRYVEGKLAGPEYARRGPMARRMLTALTAKEGGGERFSRVMDEDEIVDFPDREAARGTLERLVADHLVIREESGTGGRRVRLATEVVCPLVEVWATESPESDRAQQLLVRACRQWRDGGRRPVDLLTGSALALVRRHLPAMRGVGPDLAGFLHESLGARARRRRLALAGALAVAMVLGVAAYGAWFRHGLLELDSEPRGARVSLEGTVLGTTPLSWSGRPGTYSLRLEKPRHDPVDLLVKLTAGGLTQQRPVLRYPFGVLVVSTDPPDARCRIERLGDRGSPPSARSDSVSVMVSPFTTQLPTGRYGLTVTRPGWCPARVPEVVLGPNRELTQRTLRLEKDTGTLLVHSPPNGSACEIRPAAGGPAVRSLGLPFSAPVELASGDYVVSCVSDWSQRVDQTARITRGGLSLVDLWLDMPRRLWTTDVDSTVSGWPAVADLDGDGVPDIVFPSFARKLEAVSGADGRRLFSRRLGVKPLTSPVTGDVDGDGRPEVVVASADGIVQAFAGPDGVALWSVSLGEDVATRPVLAVAGPGADVVVAAADGTVRLLAGRTGRALWEQRLAGRIVVDPVIADTRAGGADIVVAHGGDGLSALSLADGRPLWTRSPGQGPIGSLSLGTFEKSGPVRIVVGLPRSMALAGVEDGRIVSSVDVGGPVDERPAVVDLDRDGLDELVVCVRGLGVQAFSGSTGALLWTVRTGSDAIVAPFAGDLDGTGSVEVVVGTAQGRTLVIDGSRGRPALAFRQDDGPLCSPYGALADLDGDHVPELVTAWPKLCVAAFSLASQRVAWARTVQGKVCNAPIVADLDGDGVVDVLVGTPMGALAALSGRQGRPIWSHPITTSLSAGLVPVDIDRDGVPDAVLGTVKGLLLAVSGRSGKTLWTLETGQEVEHVSPGADVDGDGTGDLAAALLEGKVLVVSSRTGRVLWTAERPAKTVAAVGPVDLDGDGSPDVVTATYEGHVEAIGRTKGTLWKYDGGMIVCRPALCDLDGDGVPDVVFGCLDGKARALSGRTGQPLWTTAVGDEITSEPALADLDGDGVPDPVFSSRDRSVTALAGRTGKALWICRLPAEPGGPMAVRVPGDPAPTLLVGTTDGVIHAVSGVTGQRLVVFHASRGAKVLCRFAFAGSGTVSRPSGPVLFVGVDDRMVVMSRPIWPPGHPAIPWAGPAATSTPPTTSSSLVRD